MRSIILSKRAAKKLNKLLEYLESEWSHNTKKQFVEKFDKSVMQIQKFPNSCLQTELVEGLHMLVITKQTSLLYRFDTESIKIITLFDNRMDPARLKKET